MKNLYLYLIWKDPETRRNYTIGKLSFEDGRYVFCYLPDAEEAKKVGWEYLKSFPENITYESNVVFSAFTSRLPDKKRRGIEAILRRYGLEQYDEFEFLRRSGARLPIDTYEFIDPILPEDETIQKDFYVMGIRYKSPCHGEDCELMVPVSCGEELSLVPEPENQYDGNALRIVTLGGQHLGYVPRYYNKEILARLAQGVTYSCVVVETNQTGQCSECIKVRLSIPRSTT